MWCFACCCFPQHPSSAYQDPWVFQHLRYSHFSKFSTLSSYRIRGPTRYEIARHLLVWAYHEWCERLYLRRAYKALFFPEISSQNTAAFCISCVFLRKMAFRLSWFSSPVSRVFAGNAWNFWCENYTFGDQIRRRTACIFKLELSYGSSSKKPWLCSDLFQSTQDSARARRKRREKHET